MSPLQPFCLPSLQSHVHIPDVLQYEHSLARFHESSFLSATYAIPAPFKTNYKVSSLFSRVSAFQSMDSPTQNLPSSYCLPSLQWNKSLFVRLLVQSIDKSLLHLYTLLVCLMVMLISFSWVLSPKMHIINATVSHNTNA